jgi:hypothetical protein
MNNNYTKNAYTLIEVLVAVAVFFVITAGPTGLMVTALRNQHRILGQSEIMDNVSYVVEYVSRNLRMAKKELDCTDKFDPVTCSCLDRDGYGFNYEVTRSGHGLKFKSYKDPSVCYEIFLDNGVLKQTEDGGAAVALTSDDSEVTLFEVRESGADQDENAQPRVTIMMEVTKANVADFPRIRIQTTVSQRNLDFNY